MRTVRIRNITAGLFPHERRYLFWIVFCLTMNLIGARADDLRILTSMSPAVFTPFVTGFEAQNPGAHVVVLNKNTNAAIEEVLRGNVREFDIFWASSPEAFDLLARHGRFAENGACPMLEPQPAHVFALSGLGWSKRSDADFTSPEQWDDLLRPLYRGKIGMARPSRSGTTHMLVERFLQVRGWQYGWAFFMELAANISTLTSRSFGVPDGVVNHRFELGLSIDFLAQSRGEELQFRYGPPIMVTPAQIGLLATMQPVNWLGCEFIAYVLSDAGQRLLLDPGVMRVPANVAIRAEAGERIPRQMLDALRLVWMKYDSQTAQRRYWVVNTLFDLFITEHLSVRRDLWRRLAALPAGASIAKVAAVRQMLTSMPVSETKGFSMVLNEAPFRVTNLTTLSADQTEALVGWRKMAKRQIDLARRALEALEQEQP